MHIDSAVNSEAWEQKLVRKYLSEYSKAGTNVEVYGSGIFRVAQKITIHIQEISFLSTRKTC